MDDLISRETVRQTLQMYIPGFKWDTIDKIVDMMPSAEPEPSSEIQDILEYLDTVLHPIISPDHWNVYSELHNMISMLPSAQPERKKGRWNRNDNGTYSCSLCQAWIPEEQHYYARYCLHCGADMREEAT